MTFKLNQQRGLKYPDCIPCKEVKPPPIKWRILGYHTKLHLKVRLQCGERIHCNYSQVHSDPEW